MLDTEVHIWGLVKKRAQGRLEFVQGESLSQRLQWANIEDDQDLFKRKFDEYIYFWSMHPYLIK